MPLITPPKNTSSGKATGKSDPVDAPGAEQGSAGPSPTSTSAPRRTGRPPSSAKLQERIKRFYMMAGTIGKPFGRWIPALEPISENLKVFADDAAIAWIELAEEDPKVKKMLESMTAASTWGNVIGVHFAIFASAVPSQAMGAMMPDDTDPIQFAKDMGLSDQEIAMAMKMAGMDTGGPGDTVQSDRKPEQAPTQSAPPIKGNGRSGIVSPEELGVREPGQEYSMPMPTDPSPPKSQ